MLKLLKKLDQQCEQHVELLVLLLTTVLLRIPNFFEPYWYGDEAIYLTIGTGIKQGLRLYTEIVDHKTPLIYYLAAVPSQFQFRLLNLVWMMVATAFFYWFAKKIFKKAPLAFLSSLVLVLLTSLPWLEGNIPNGELFVIGFISAGLWLLSKTELLTKFLANKPEEALKSNGQEQRLLLGVGALFSLGLLTKVPALLDFGAVLLIVWFAVTNLLIGHKFKVSLYLKALGKLLSKLSWLLIGFLIPIGLSVLYFVSQGSGQDYLQFGLLYNIHYSGNWDLNLVNPLLEFLFTLPGKVLVMAGVIGSLSLTKKLTPRFKLIAGWFVLALFAATLSNRPYPHYYLQLVPPLALLITELWLVFTSNLKVKKTMLAAGAGLIFMAIAVFRILGFSHYSVSEYYGKFYKLVTHQISMEEYDNSFNGLVADNYQVAEIIRGLDGHRMFIWGTNPMLYALTEATPTSRFTVSFHIKDLNDYANTMDQIRAEQPTIIVVMKDETEELPGLEQYLNTYYYPNTQYETMTLYLLQDNRD